jgi:hypothetical protein
MRRAFLLCAVISFFCASCAPQQPTPTPPVSGTGLKRIVQLDINTNQLIHYWNARAETIHQHVTPPVGISFTDADTGQNVQFNGTYKIESYQKGEASATPNESTSQNAETHAAPARPR